MNTPNGAGESGRSISQENGEGKKLGHEHGWREIPPVTSIVPIP